MHLGEVLQPQRRGFPLVALENEYPRIRDAGRGRPASIVDVRPGSGDLGEVAPDLIAGLAAIAHPRLERREASERGRILSWPSQHVDDLLVHGVTTENLVPRFGEPGLGC